MPRLTIGRLIILIAVAGCVSALFVKVAGPFGPLVLVIVTVVLVVLAMFGSLTFALTQKIPFSAFWIVMAYSATATLCAIHAKTVNWYGTDAPISTILMMLLMFSLSAGATVGWIVRAKTWRDWSRVGGLVVSFIVPLGCSIGDWPLYLAFDLSQPALDRLADRIEAGGTLQGSEWAGVYRVETAAVDPDSGEVFLVITKSARKAGFVRRSKIRSARSRALHDQELWIHQPLRVAWEHRAEYWD